MAQQLVVVRKLVRCHTAWPPASRRCGNIVHGSSAMRHRRRRRLRLRRANWRSATALPPPRRRRRIFSRALSVSRALQAIANNVSISDAIQRSESEQVCVRVCDSCIRRVYVHACTRACMCRIPPCMRTRTQVEATAHATRSTCIRSHVHACMHSVRMSSHTQR